MHTLPQIRTFTALMLRSPLRLFFLFWAAIALLYLPAWRGGFGQDFHGWLQLYYDDSFWDCINRRGSGIKSFYQVTQLQLYFWTTLFGTHALPWFLLFTGLHAWNGVLLYRLCARIFGDLRLANADGIAILGTALFLLAPGMTEVVVWKACYHYLIGLQIVLWCLLWCREYLIHGNRRPVWLSLVITALATGTLETWYLILPSVLLLIVVYRRAGLVTAVRTRKAVLLLCLPMLCLFAGHLLLYRLQQGFWLPHSAYRMGNEGSALSVAAKLWSYEAHLLGFARFWPQGLRQYIYPVPGREALAGWAAIAIVAGCVIITFLRLRKSACRYTAVALLGGWGLGALIIVLHYDPEALYRIHNDRYLYFTGAFQYLLLALLLPRRRALFRASGAFLLLLQLWATLMLVLQWRQGTRIFWRLQDNFRWGAAPAVVLLNLPCTYNGVGIINTHRPSDFPEHLRIFYKQPNRRNVYDVANYNMLHPWDGAHVAVLDSGLLRVTLNQWGTWWQWAGFGASDFETPQFAVHFTDPGHEYLLRLKREALPAGTVILFQQGQQWREVDMSRRGEQW